MRSLRQVVWNLHVLLLSIKAYIVKADCKHYFLLHDLFARVSWQLEVKEASVRFWQPLVFDMLRHFLFFLLLIVSSDRSQQES